MNLLNIEDISIKLNNKDILSKINFSLKTGEVLSIIGPSGSGKSSILRVIAGLLRPNLGKVIYNNKIISSKKKIIPTGKRNIGLMFQEDVLFPHLTVYQNVEFGLNNLLRKKKELLVNNYLKEFGIYEKKNDHPNLLSGGEKQRVALARILITKPKILLMDEPFSNLDNNLRKDICDFTLNTLKKNKISVIFVTHDIEEALRVSDNVMVIKSGKIIQKDTPQELYSNPKSKYVAKLLGLVNQFEVKADRFGKVLTPFGKVNCINCLKESFNCKEKKHFCIIRPDSLIIGNKGIKGKIVEKYFLGSSWSYKVKLNETNQLFNVANCKKELNLKQLVKIYFDMKNILIFQE